MVCAQHTEKRKGPMTVTPENVDALHTVSLKSTATDDAAWVGGYFAYGGSKSEQSCTIC